MKDSPRRTCLRCGGELERGYAFIRDTTWGLSSSHPWITHLYFAPAGEEVNETRFLQWPDKHVTYRCLGCGDTVITQHRWE